ncbi:MAG: hypothetical protein M3Q97_03045 [Bacteroidota bacterium]|nr:hypothetical protein [Bacteroidota bacterium]
MNYLITYNKDRINGIYIHFKKVRIENICLDAMGPAWCRIEFPNLSDGEYPVTFELNNKKTKGKLIVGQLLS